ncbi:ring-cleaving dioxygenase [Bacillus sp. 165]|uniref:ring-cleaving dioxygenase n=1 Tax=Bacillus sp. 165 TaxID=1529117 RepID=UPI001ADAA3F9|nr:ring-cleaving dioxygenase [Bacillus sp. 165]MBO9130552.1 ring-cleaving dioxygenase [Bacillus sp. 165]
MELKGLHHVSALTANAVKNYEFYTKVLGLRLIKKTVNQDDTSVYHLFYGDGEANPGTELTFFEIPMMGRHYRGVSSISSISLRVPNRDALDYWAKRLDDYQIERDEVIERAGRATLAFRDFENQHVILTADSKFEGVPGGIPWSKSPVPHEYGIIGLGPVTLTVRKVQSTVRVLTDVLGFRQKESYLSLEENQPAILVFETGAGGSGAEVHVEERTDLPMERQGRGAVHHVAFRVENKEELLRWQEIIEQTGLSTSGMVDRYYFQALYFREPNGILFELSTDGPGFTADEKLEELGENLALPPFLEPYRENIEAKLKPLDTK